MGCGGASFGAVLITGIVLQWHTASASSIFFKLVLAAATAKDCLVKSAAMAPLLTMWARVMLVSLQFEPWEASARETLMLLLFAMARPSISGRCSCHHYVERCNKCRHQEKRHKILPPKSAAKRSLGRAAASDHQIRMDHISSAPAEAEEG